MSTYIQLVQQQSRILDKVKTLESNFKKDGAFRKTPDYLLKRLSTLEALWQEFEQNNNLILASADRKESDEYFVDNIYEKVKQLFMNTRQLIISNPQGASTPVKPVVTAESSIGDKQLNEMLSEQRSNIKAFERAVKNITIENISEKWLLEDELKTLTVRWNNIDRLYWKIDNLSEDSTHDDEYNRIEQQFKMTKEKINRKIWSQIHQEKAAPKIELPSFNGNFESWLTFKDLFVETVHCNSFISNAQKMQHLKSKLRGEAEKLVQHLPISTDNYEICWDILKQRYDNIRMIFAHHASTLLNQPSIKPTASELKKMHDTTLEALNAINNMNVDSWDPLIVHILMQKLDPDTTASYLESLPSQKELPTLSEFMSFLEGKFLALESSNKVEKPQNNNTNSNNNFYKKQSFQQKKPQTKVYHTAIRVCPNCNGEHGLYFCKSFLDATPFNKLKMADKLRVCRNCLFSHNGQECNSTKKCKYCNKSHNSLLHEALDKSARPSTSSGQQHNTHVSSNDESNDVLLATIQMKVQAADGTYTTLRGLLDGGSQTTMIREDAVQRLRLKRNKYDAVVTGLGITSFNRCKGVVQLTCQAVHNSYEFQCKALVMKTLTNKLPNNTFNKNAWNHIQHLKLADPEFNVSRDIDILLGADVYSEIIMDGLIKGINTNIIAQQTQLGWVVCGKMKTFNCHVVLNNMESLTKFWEQEEITETIQTNSDDFCEKLYQTTTTRLPDGRYEVRLPMKPGFEEKIGESKPQAIAQFKQLEQKMKRNTGFEKDYKDFMVEYENLGHMTQINNHQQGPQYFLPHHGVIRAEAVTTKLRVVFNASAKTKTGFSLNELMENTPNLQADLQTLILQWRQNRFVFTADIEKMYRFISVHPDDRALQQIIWRDSPEQTLKRYELNTVTYGTKAAPYLAIRTLKQLAHDEGDTYPVAKPILEQNFFVDDVLFGKQTIEEAKFARDELIKMLSRGGFNLRKWSSNEQTLVQDLPTNMRNPTNFDFTDTETSKTLGLSWKAQSDEFHFKSQLQQTSKITKRVLLSEIAKLFDPLGWLSPITVKTKILFQQVWISKIEWDEELPENMKKEWFRVQLDMVNIENINIKRWLGFNNINKEIELHAFCDASEKAYAVVVYSVVKLPTGEPYISLIAAKTKLAPLRKQITLPRLELCGAVLLTRLTKKVINSLTTTNIITYAWTDSMVVLGWIKGSSDRWKTYVANRVEEIKQVIPPKSWQHIKSEQNPADCATRGLLPSQLQHFSLWWNGPDNIRNKVIEEDLSTYNTDLETKTIKQNTYLAQSSEPSLINNIITKHSSITKAVRVLAWVLRFKTIARDSKSTLRTRNLTLQELRQTLIIIIKQIQEECFEKEIQDLKSKRKISQRSNLLNLNPFLDEQGILRLSGRLQNSSLDFEQKHPIIIPQNNKLTALLIEHYHRLTLHGGTKLTLAHLRQRYWIIGGNKTVKNHLRKCVKCARYKPIQQTQLMGNLPKARVRPSRPFENCGVDMAGPVEIKANKGRGIRTCKGYICVFVCMATKALHLELVSDLSTQAFLAALKRLSARRGVPKNIFSDNGTNFVGANRELKKLFKENKTFSSETFNRATTDMEVHWHFNAAAWPTAGGIWERAVRSIKGHIKHTIGLQKLTFEEYTTLLCQIEGCLNSRPLTTLTEDPEDLEYGVLTPGHFLIGEPLLTIPEPDLSDEITFKTRWQLITRMKQDFWRKWSRDYLQELQTRTKWQQEKNNIEIGDVVVIKEDNLAPGRWALGKVEEVHPGSDGLVRVMTLKTQKGKLKRPITKIIKLPVEHEQNDPKQKTNKQVGRGTMGTVWQYLCVLLTFMSLITSSYSHQHNQYVNISQFEENRPIYYDEIGQLQTIHNNWKIITFYNMTTYWTGIQNIENYISHINSVCKRFAYQAICDGIVTELEQERDQIEHNNKLLIQQNKIRMKRGFFNGIGQLANSLFGVLDEEFAVQYRQDIEYVQKNEQHLLHLIKNQTTIIETQNNLLQRNENSMNKQFQLMNDHIKNADTQLSLIEEQNEHDRLMTYFTTMAFSTNMIILKLRFIQENIIDSLTNIHEGRIYSNIISQEQLLQQLGMISTKLPPHLSLPVEDINTDLLNIYKLLHVKARITDNYFIFEIKLPLLEDTQYSLYKVIPVPVINKGNSLQIIPKHQYIAINMLSDIYLGLEQNDLQSCVTVKQNKYLCTFNKPIKSMKQSNAPCEISLLNKNNEHKCQTDREQCINKWVELHKPSTWLFVCCEECELRIICQEHIIVKSAKRSGTITIGQGCSIKSDETIIQTDNTYQTKMYIDPQIPTVVMDDINNLTKLTNIEKLRPIEQEDHSETFNNMKQELKKLKEQSELPQTISEHDVHQYAVSYITLVIILTFATVGGVYWRCRGRGITAPATAPAPAPAAATRHDAQCAIETIEMTSLPRNKLTKKHIYALPTRQRQFNI